MVLTFRVQQQIVQLKVAVDDFILVKILKTEDDARRVENGARLAEHVGVNVHHQVTARCVLHHEADVLLVEGKSFQKIF